MKITRLRSERMKRGLTLEQVGKQVGVSKQAIHQIETLKSNPSYPVLQTLCNIFDLYDFNLLEQIEVKDPFSSTN